MDKFRNWKIVSFFVSLLVFIAFVCTAQASLTITSPTAGTIFAPGSSMQVTVDTGANSFASVGIVVSNPGRLGTLKVLTSPPYQFTVPLPSDTTGPRQITAFAVDQAGNDVSSTPITIDVEPNVPISSIAVDPSTIAFSAAGDQIPLTVSGTFSDGATVDLTGSSITIYKSANANVANIDSRGLVTAVGPGGTTLIVTYGGLSSSVPVTVPLGNATPVYKVTATPIGGVVKDAFGNYAVKVNITNNGNSTLDLVTLTSAVLNTTGTNSLPVRFTVFEPNASKTITLAFSPTAGSSGASASLLLKGTYEGQTGNQGALNFSFRVKLP